MKRRKRLEVREQKIKLLSQPRARLSRKEGSKERDFFERRGGLGKRIKKRGMR